MAASIRAPKQWCLSKSETINTFENWKQNLTYTLSLDSNFAPFLTSGASWLKSSKTTPLRGFTDDGDEINPADRRKTAQQKVSLLELMLGQVANYCPVVSRNTIVKNSTSLESIWQAIRLHFGFQTTGAHFLEFDNIQLLPDERPEDLYQRLVAFVEDNLLTTNCGIRHLDEPAIDEELTPTTHNLIVLTWLRLIHPSLPRLVKQRYGTDLRSRTLASIKPEISQALDSLLDEINGSAAQVMRTRPAPSHSLRPTKYTSGRPKPPQKSCPLCKQAGRRDSGHYLSECAYLPDSDKRYMARARQIVAVVDSIDSDQDGEEEYTTDPQTTDEQYTVPTARRINISMSPYVDVFHNHQPVRITIDTGATGNMIHETTAVRLGAKIQASSQSARQADGSSPLTVIGETRLTFSRGSHQLTFDGLVVKELDVAILAGVPFMEANDVSVRPAKRSIVFRDGSTASYGSPADTPPNGLPQKVRRATVLRAPKSSTTVWPGDFLEVPLPDDLVDSSHILAVEPRPDLYHQDNMWPAPDVIESVGGNLRILNDTNHPIALKKNQHFCQVREVFVPPSDHTSVLPPAPASKPSHQTEHLHSLAASIDPEGLLTCESREKFANLLHEFDSVFDPRFPGYNGASGPFKAVVNMGPVLPPQRKGRLPQYAKNRLMELQEKFDDLEELGVFVRPEDAKVTAEYVNPSFLVNKPNGGTRLVTAFADVGRYSKPQPAVLPDIDSTLRKIANWHFIITSDLTSAFYQIPLDHNSMKYCGVVTPFRGVRLYARSAMGMPGSETALEELMCRVLGDLLIKGCVAKIADDLYCGGNSVTELLCNWRRVLESLHQNGLRLSAKKTVVCPKSVTILGWIWQQGTLQASSHRIAALSSCTIPTTVKGLRSFIGAYKVLARVLPGCAIALAPLDDLVAGKDSCHSIDWSETGREAFLSAQKKL